MSRPNPRRTSLAFTCPECGAVPGKPCKGSRIPSANTLGGGWGGPPPRKRPHDARLARRREWLARMDRQRREHEQPLDLCQTPAS